MTFTIYHGSCSRPAVETAREHAPSIRHGHCWTPQKQTPAENAWILDNGVYSAWRNDREWDASEWIDTVADCREKMPQPPDFVVLPDVVGDADATVKRSRKYVDEVESEWSTAFAAQDGMTPGGAVAEAESLGCDYLFVGGTHGWKRRMTGDIIDAAADLSVDVHVARPSLPDGLLWAKQLGAVSVDTTSIVTTPSYHHLTTLEEQTTLEATL